MVSVLCATAADGGPLTDPGAPAGPRAASVCGVSAPGAPTASAARVPDSFAIAEQLRPHAETMLLQSIPFREQCARLASAPLLLVRVRIDVGLLDRSYRARSLIQRSSTGLIIAWIDLPPNGSQIEWLAHELEHVLEQLDGVALPVLAERGGGAWRTAADMFESSRAIRAGRAVAAEIRGRRSGPTILSSDRRVSDNLVDPSRRRARRAAD
jgi:hypothetical protein